MKNRILCFIAVLVIGCNFAEPMSVCAAEVESVEDYDLVVIEDEETALAPRISTEQLFPAAVTGIVLIIVLLLLAAYIMECQKYRARLTKLQTQREEGMPAGGSKRSWNLFTLKKQMKQMEESLVENMMHF